MKHLSIIESFGKPICVYTIKNAIEDGVLIKVGKIKDINLPVVFTKTLFEKVKPNYREIVDKGLLLLNSPDNSDSDESKFRIVQKDFVWVIANQEGVTFMMPTDY